MFPLLGVPALLLLRSEDHVWIRRIALTVSVIEFGISLLLLRGFDSSATGYQFEEYSNWIGRAIHYHIGLDGISLFLVLLTTFLAPIAILCSWEAIHANVKGFFIALVVIETAMIGVFVSLDLFLFFLFWEVTLIPMYFLIGIWGHDRRIYAAMKFILYTMFGSILMLVAVLWLYNITGTFDFPLILAQLQKGPALLSHNTELWLFGAFFLAFAIKVPLFPLHTWLPDAHTEAPTAGSVILAGVMLKLGTYGMLRFCVPLFPYAAHRSAKWIGILAIIGIVYGALVATVQTNFKRLIAYTSVSHLGFVVLAIFSFTPISIEGAVYQMVAHGISTGGLFLGLGMIYDRRHTYEIKEYGGLATPMPVYATLFLLITLSSIGLPLMNGFVGEFLILSGAFQAKAIYGIIAATGVIWSAFYMLWLYQRTFYGAVTVPVNATLPDANLRERSILWPLAIVALIMGIFPSLWMNSIDASVAGILGAQQAASSAPTLQVKVNTVLK